MTVTALNAVGKTADNRLTQLDTALANTQLAVNPGLPGRTLPTRPPGGMPPPLLRSLEGQRQLYANGGAIELAKAMVGITPALMKDVGPYIAQVLVSVVSVLPKDQRIRGFVLRQVFENLQEKFPQFTFGEFNFNKNIVFYGERAGVFVTPGGDVYHGKYPEFDSRTGEPGFWSPSNKSFFQQVVSDVKLEFRGRRPESNDWLRTLQNRSR
jgi:hypothetical protein